MADNLSLSERLLLSQLSGKPGRSRASEEVFSTTDSGAGHAETQDEALGLLPSGPEERKAPKTRTAGTSPSEPPSRNKRAVVVAAPSPNTQEKRVQKFHCAGQSSAATNAPHNMWRPW